MKSSIEALTYLYKTLKEEQEIIGKMYKSEEKKHKVIMKGKLTDLTPYSNEMSKLADELNKLETKRLAGLMRVGSYYKINEKEITLKMIIDKLDSPEKEEFEKLYDSFNEIVSSFKRLNALNGELLKDQIGLIQTIVNACLGDGILETNYGENKEDSTKANSLIFDFKA